MTFITVSYSYPQVSEEDLVEVSEATEATVGGKEELVCDVN